MPGARVATHDPRVGRGRAASWENGYNESFNGKLRDELLNGGDLLLVGGGGRAGRAMEARVRYRPTPQRPLRLSPGP